MMNDTHLDPNSFDQAYAVLKRNADLLSQQQEPSIDRLLPLVEESMRAYDICKARLAAIRQALEQQLSSEPGANPVNTSAPVAAEEWPWEVEESMESSGKAKPVDENEIPF